MLDLIADVIEALLSGGGVPAPVALESQRRARALSAAAAVMAIVAGPFFSGSTSITLVAGGAIVAAWALAFSLVDLVKESPPVQWTSVLAIIVAGMGLATAARFALHIYQSAL